METSSLLASAGPGPPRGSRRRRKKRKRRRLVPARVMESERRGVELKRMFEAKTEDDIRRIVTEREREAHTETLIDKLCEAMWVQVCGQQSEKHQKK